MDKVEAAAAGTATVVPTYETMLEASGNDARKAMFEYCFRNDICFMGDILSRVLRTGGGDTLPNSYLDALKAAGMEGKTFLSQLRIDNFETIYSRDSRLAMLDEEDRKNRLQVIDVLGYDPFQDDDQAERPGLYRDMTGMLNEGMRKDVAKTKAALAFVRGYNNLEKYQRKINEIMKQDEIDEDTQKRLDQYIKIQKTLQDSINQTAEKNNFTVKGIGSNGRGMLSDVMIQVEERGIDEGITNFYDIQTSKSIEEVANISMKAQLNQINLSKTDYADILSTQCEITRKAQARAAEAMEALRLCREKLKKQELLDELASEYRQKGISEDEIGEFIQREYKLYDGSSAQ